MTAQSGSRLSARRRLRRPAAAITCLALGAAALAACGSSGSSSTSSTTAGSSSNNSTSGTTAGSAITQKTSTHGDTLTIAEEAPTSLNPADSADNSLNAYVALDYASLINWTNSNTFTPGLATKWGYVGNKNEVFNLTIRSGVKFADGEALTAKAVAASINYFKTGAGPVNADFKDITATATGPLTVELKSTTPNPQIEELLSPFYNGGAIIAPKGLADSKALQTTSYGAGEYVLQPSQSVTGSYYTYTANPNYYDPSSIHYKKVVIKVMTDETSAVAALRTGQIDLYIGGSNATASSAKADGIQVLGAPAYWEGLQIIDPQGKVAAALANLKVRQAIEYALDRPAIAQAVFGSYGSADDEPAWPGTAWYVKSLADEYTYNPTKAKQLLAAAGYSHGFTLPITFLNFGPFQRLMEAIGGELSAIGIKVDFTPETTIPGMLQEIYSKKVAAFDIPESNPNVFGFVSQYFLNGSNLNPLNEVNPTLISMFNTASDTVGSAATPLWQKVVSYLTTDAYTIPAVVTYQLYYASKSVADASVNPTTAYMDYTALEPAS